MTDNAPRYAELHCTSNFSFLQGASHPEELIARAAALGYEALAITDRAALTGVVRAHAAAKQAGIKLVIGAHLEPVDALPIVVWATDAAGYSNLCQLLTHGYAQAAEVAAGQQDHWPPRPSAGPGRRLPPHLRRRRPSCPRPAGGPAAGRVWPRRPWRAIRRRSPARHLRAPRPLAVDLR
jgi:hypothetical protein